MSTINDNAKKRVGTVIMQSCGMPARCTEYNGFDDITVIFKNGTVRKHVYWKAFKAGKVAFNPRGGGVFNNPTGYHKAKKERIGEKVKQRCGQTAKIIRYRSARDIDVEFEDKSIRRHVRYQSFKEKKLFPKGSEDIRQVEHRQLRLGEIHKQCCGLKAKIIAYRKASDIDVVFEDGEVVCNTRYDVLLKGYIAHPEYTKQEYPKGVGRKMKDRTGERKIMLNGLQAQITEYRRANDITVEFEDGAVVKHTTCGAFDRQLIGYPKSKKGGKVLYKPKKKG